MSTIMTKHPYWRHFVEWAEKNGVSSDPEMVTCQHHWECWLDGFQTAQISYGRPETTLEGYDSDG